MATPASNQNQTNQVTVIIAEFEKLKDEIHQSEISLQHTLIIIGVSFSIVVPLLIDNITRFSSDILKLLLLFLVIIYSAITMNYCWFLYSVFALGKYINDYLYKQINDLLETQNGHELLYWEPFIREYRKKPIVLISSAGS
jgi:hypothetical protein